MVYAARDFNGTSDWLDTGLGQCKGITQTQSIYAWVHIASIGSARTVLGCVEFGGTRYQFRVEASNIASTPRLLIQMLVPFGQIDANPLTGTYLLGENVFVAFVNDVANNRARCFWGLTPATVVEVATSDFSSGFTAITTFSNPVFLGTTVHLGAAGREGTTPPENHFDGVIDSVGLVFDVALTLEQLKERAFCGLGAETYHWPIDGTDPEPGITVINGTTVVDGICAPFVEAPIAGAQLVTVM